MRGLGEYVEQPGTDAFQASAGVGEYFTEPVSGIGATMMLPAVQRPRAIDWARALSPVASRAMGQTEMVAVVPAPSPAMQAAKLVGYAGSLAGGVLGAYHGYKRNKSIGWAVGWAILGTFFWVVTLPVSYAQGFGKRK
jgi:hypothetical protein